MKDTKKSTWDNEAGALELHVAGSDNLKIMEGTFSAIDKKKSSSSEKRVLEFEVMVDKAVTQGDHAMKAYACYYVCDQADGSCAYLRQDVKIQIKVDSKAPSIR